MGGNDIARGPEWTKCDKVSKNGGAKVAAQTAQDLRLARPLVIPVAAEKGRGRDELGRHLTAQKRVTGE